MPSPMCEGVETDLSDRAYGNEFVCMHVCMKEHPLMTRVLQV